MSGWYSNIVGATTSKISNLQRTLLNSEADGDTEDDTHVCRVLRSYYTEKGRPFPNWLPPDPKAPPPVAPVYAQPASQVGARYGGLSQQGPGPGAGASSGLSSLWDSGPAQQQQQVPQSLRQGRAPNPAQQMLRPGAGPFRNSDPMAGTGGGGGDGYGRPLPSQRAGSYQSAGPTGGSPSPYGAPAASGGGSAQDRLKQRLYGGSRTASPASGGPFNPPAPPGGPINRRPAPGGPRMR